jgi:hypothetical protein
MQTFIISHSHNNRNQASTESPNGFTVCLMDTSGAANPRKAAAMCAAGAAVGPPAEHRDLLYGSNNNDDDDEDMVEKPFHGIVANTPVDWAVLAEKVRAQPEGRRSPIVVLLPSPGVGGQMVSDISKRQIAKKQE